MSSSERLDVRLTHIGAFESRAKAAAAIQAGLVTVDGAVARKPGLLVRPEAVVEAEPAFSWVGRGALKLVGALDLWPVAVDGRVCLDVGASTGGFTEVLLSRGAARVYAVDVGRGQLHPRVEADSRVVSLQGTDARRLDRALVPEPVGLVVCDASFIGLGKVLGAALVLAEPGAELVALVKPQFEVGPERVGKGGVVRDRAARAEAVAAARAWLEGEGWGVRGETESPITGGDGNVETLVWAVRS